MQDDSTTRLSRLTSILTMLLSRRLLTATEIGRKFGVSTRTVYRDIRALEEAGVPIVTEEGKGYCLMDGYKLPPIMFTEAEAYALITAEQIMLKNKDASLRKGVASAIGKIKTVLNATSQAQTELLTERMNIGKNWDNLETSDCLITMQMALTDLRPVKITYATPDGEPTERIIEPFAIYHNAQEDWTLAAFCRLRQDFRAFRLDRIQKMQVLDGHFERHALTMPQYIEKYTRPRYP